VASTTAALLVWVDDEEAIGTALRRSLVDHDVVPVSTPRRRCGSSARAAFDVILCEIMMPDGPAWSSTKRQVQRPRQASRFVFSRAALHARDADSSSTPNGEDP